MIWQVLGRCCRPTVDTFFVLLLFSVAGTLLMVLWAYEPTSRADQRAGDEEMRLQLVEQLIRDKQQEHQQQLRHEVDRLDTVSDHHHPHLGDAPLNDQRQASNRRVDESPQRRRAVYHAGNDDDKLPEMVLENTGRTRTPKQAVRLSANRTGREALVNDRRSSANSSNGDDFLRRVRLKLLADVTAGPEVDRRRSEPVLDNSRRRWCSVYNTTADVGGDQSFDCKRLLIKPMTTVCLYADADDVHVSRHVREDGLWEPHIVRLFQNLLFQNPELGVIDIGAHVGQYSLLAASMRRPVVAVEPYPPSLRRLHRAISINNVDKQVTHAPWFLPSRAMAWNGIAVV